MDTVLYCRWPSRDCLAMVKYNKRMPIRCIEEPGIRATENLSSLPCQDGYSCPRRLKLHVLLTW